MPLIFLILISFAIGTTKIRIPIQLVIIWLEVNLFGRTYLPEGLVIMQITAYIMWRLLWWKFLSEIKITTREKAHM